MPAITKDWAMPADLSPADHPDVPQFLAFVIREAEHQASLACAFMRALHDLAGPGDDPPPVRLTRADMFKAAAYMRIRQWELSGLRAHLTDPLPPADEILHDLLREPGTTERFDGDGLARVVTRAAWTRLAWETVPEAGAEVAVEHRAPPERAADVLAALLWRFRHLSN